MWKRRIVRGVLAGGVMGLSACGEPEPQADAPPPPLPGLENAATTSPSVTVEADSAGQQEPSPGP